MATEQPAFGFPNFLDVTFTGSGITKVEIGGGDWLDTRPLTNLQDTRRKNQARSASLAVADATFDIDVGAGRDVKVNFIPDHNISNTGQLRLQASNVISWSGFTVDGVNSIGATTLNVIDGTGTPVLGEIFTIAGDTTLYVVVSFVATTITLKRSNISGTGLVVATTGAEVITCHSGDFDGSSLLDTGLVNVVPVIYPFGTLEFGHPAFFDGKPTAEERPRLKIPYINVQVDTILAQYWRYIISDPDNLDGFIEFPRLFVSRGYLPTQGIKYLSSIKRSSKSTRKDSKGGASFISRNPNQRSWQIAIENLPDVEALSRFFDIQDEADIELEIVFIKDINDLELSHQTAFACRFNKLDPVAFPFIDAADIIAELIEVTG